MLSVAFCQATRNFVFWDCVVWKVAAGCTRVGTDGAFVSMTNVAVTLWSVLMVRLHAAVPVQSPDQPVKTVWVPAVTLAVSCTAVPAANAFEQVVPQVMPEGVLVTVPL